MSSPKPRTHGLRRKNNSPHNSGFVVRLLFGKLVDLVGFVASLASIGFFLTA